MSALGRKVFWMLHIVPPRHDLRQRLLRKKNVVQNHSIVVTKMVASQFDTCRWSFSSWKWSRCSCALPTGKERNLNERSLSTIAGGREVVKTVLPAPCAQRPLRQAPSLLSGRRCCVQDCVILMFLTRTQLDSVCAVRDSFQV